MRSCVLCALERWWTLPRGAWEVRHTLTLVRNQGEVRNIHPLNGFTAD